MSGGLSNLFYLLLKRKIQEIELALLTSFQAFTKSFILTFKSLQLALESLCFFVARAFLDARALL